MVKHNMLKVIEYKMCVLIFSTNLSEKFLMLRGIQRDIVINVHGYLCEVPVVLVGINENLIFSTDFEKRSNISNILKSRPLGAELFQADRRRDRHD